MVAAIPWTLDELQMPDLFVLPDEPAHEESIEVAQEREAAEQAREELAQVEAAYARGYADAEAALLHHSESRIAPALTAFASAIESVRVHEARWTSNAEENVAALAVVVARHVVQREVTTDPSIVRDLVQRTLAQFPIDQAVSVRLHPDDVETCGTLLAAGSPVRARGVQWIADPTIQRGGCLTEGRERIIDGRVDTSLERAYRAIGQVES